jgi:two-component system CheB/CheR fusion protein
MKRKPLPKSRPHKATKAVPRKKSPQAPPAAFPIVGIGASAGGLDALEQFLGHVPAGSGLAYVIIQHMDPTHKGILPELLQRATAMKVVQVRDRTRVRPDCVYVIPPNKDLSVLHGVLHLFEPAAARGLRLPIDFFFRSLAQDRHEQSIGVILSGMGSDGRLGLRAIKERAGTVLVQEPATAKFDSMPRSAIETGLADIVAPAAELPGRLLAHLQLTPLLPQPELVLTDGMQSALGKAIVLLRSHTGHDFSLYKRNTLYRRIERRMSIHQIDTMATYVRYLQENPQELDLLFKELLIGVTNFFRDGDVWDQLREQVIPALVGKRAADRTLRAWVPGCSTGEEAYSLAILLKEAIDDLSPKGEFTIQIFATDLDQDAVDKARQGVFPSTIAANVSDERLRRFFTKEERRYRVRKEIREMVVFAQQNLIMDPPFTRLDILSCRNLLIYLTQEVQRRLIPIFHYSLNPGGVLLLGSAETVGHCTDLFSPLGAKSRLFQRLETGPQLEPVLFPASFHANTSPRPEARATPAPPSSLQSLADQLVLQRCARPTVFTNDKGDICYVSGRTGAYLEPAAGKADWNIFVMAREGLRYELAGAFQEALRRKQGVTLHGLTVASNGVEQGVDVTIQRLDEPGPLQGLVIIVFTDVPTPPPPKPLDAPPRRSPGAARG